MAKRYVTILTANLSSFGVVRDDAKVDAIKASRQAYYDGLLINVTGCTQVDIDSGKVKRDVVVNDFSAPILDDEDNSIRC